MDGSSLRRASIAVVDDGTWGLVSRFRCHIWFVMAPRLRRHSFEGLRIRASAQGRDRLYSSAAGF